MRKRIFSIAMTLCMVLAMMPATAWAADSHLICGGDVCNHVPVHETLEHTTHLPNSVINGNYIQVSEGNYYRDPSYPTYRPIKFSGEVNLCLNNLTVGTRSIFASNTTLNICDCGSAGKISSGAAISTIALENSSGTIVNLYSGTIEYTGDGTDSRAIRILNNGGSTTKVNLYGGTVKSTNTDAIEVVSGGQVNLCGNTTITVPDGKAHIITHTEGAINASGYTGNDLRILVDGLSDSAVVVTNVNNTTEGKFSVSNDGHHLELVGNNLVYKADASPSYAVNITPGSGMTKTGGSGDASQNVTQGSAMTEVVYQANDGFYFPEGYSVTGSNGIIVTRNSYSQITVSGTPTAAVNLELDAATAKTKADTPEATFNATGANTGTLSGVTNGMKYSTNGGITWTDINSSADINLTNLSAGTISVVKKGNGTTTLDSDPKTLTISKPAAPSGLTVTQPSSEGGKGSIETTAAHEYSTNGTNFSACNGALNDLVAGTYYVRVKANGTALASENASYTIIAYSATPTYGINLSQSGTYNFTVATVGYGAQLAKTVTVNNAGNQATGALTVAVVAVAATVAAANTLHLHIKLRADFLKSPMAASASQQAAQRRVIL